jgi:thiol:disulfide interchange protein
MGSVRRLTSAGSSSHADTLALIDVALYSTVAPLWHARKVDSSIKMSSPARSIAIAAAVLLLAAGSGCRQTPETTPVAEELGHAVIYPDGAQAEADITAALAKATREKKRVLLDFGGNWCGDCQVLEIYFHDPANRNLLESNYVLVPVNIGQYDENLSIAAERRVQVHAQNGFAVGDRLPARVEGLESG